MLYSDRHGAGSGARCRAPGAPGIGTHSLALVTTAAQDPANTGVFKREAPRVASPGLVYPGAVSALPGRCSAVSAGGVTQYSCAGTSYRPYYHGPNLVYVPEVR
jgi:hypothetical protein